LPGPWLSPEVVQAVFSALGASWHLRAAARARGKGRHGPGWSAAVL